MSEAVLSLGLMSGTSLDGIDAALVKTDGARVISRGSWLTVPYTLAVRRDILELIQGRGDIATVERDLTLLHAEAVKKLLKKAGRKPYDVAVIGFHGQTIQHRPKEGITWQIGDGSLLAEATGIDVVCDFRRRDLAAGGQGAPLVPLYHAALARDLKLPVAVVNIGGIANVTWVSGKEDIVAFDTGPGNVLLDTWVQRFTGRVHDTGGKFARAGEINENALRAYLSDGFFRRRPPKSLDRQHFTLKPLARCGLEDGAATLVAVTAETIALAAKHFPAPPKRWLITGGGRHNKAIMKALKARLGNVEPVEAVKWEGDALEAQAFAFLAVRSLLKLPLTLPTTTGVSRAVTGGAFYPA